nr:SDR family NAD(P)-dependent oxidoreductase [Kitasatospora arboriphila]
MTTPTVDPTTLRLDGKRALITGATKGIGADIAVTLARAGADLILSGRNKVELDEAAATLSREHGTRVATVVADLADTDGPEALARAAAGAFDGLDILINNAGISYPIRFSTSTPSSTTPC